MKTIVTKLIWNIRVIMSEILYKNSESSRKIKALKDIHNGRRCFVVGNGPSLTSSDLDMITDEITFGFNRIYHMFSNTNWRPTYYMSQDDKTFINSVDEIANLKLDNMFFPLNFKRDYHIDVKNSIHFIFRTNQQTEFPEFQSNIRKGIYDGNSVVYSAIQMAIYMGIKEIYLIGVDHSFSKSIDDNGLIVLNSDVKDYFTNEYNLDRDNLHIPNLDKSTRGYITARDYAMDCGVGIFNATRGGKLEVYKRVDIDYLFN